MNIICDSCSLSIQVSDDKIPDRSFTVRCPRCQNVVRVQGKSASAVDQLEANSPAPALEEGSREFSAKESEFEVNKAIRSLLSALQKDSVAVESRDAFDEKPRRLLLCVGKNRDRAAQVLTKAGFKVYAAETPAQANERLREGKTEILVFSTDFAADVSGGVAVQKRINAIAPAERRRLYMVLLEDNVETLNAHQAFLRNLNLLINTHDIDKMPLIINRAVRDFNELYHFYNRATGAQPL